MKDKFDEDFLEIENKQRTSKDFKRGMKINLCSEELDNFKKEGICEKEFKDFGICEAKTDLSKIGKNFCDKTKDLLVQCLYRSGKDINI